MTLRLSHETRVTVTGASSGLGRELALALAARGARLALVARSRDRLEQTAAQCIERGAARAVAYPLDLADIPAIDCAFTDIAGRLGAPADLVLHAAGRAPVGNVHEIPAAAARACFEVNVLATAEIIRVCAPAMIARRAGAIGAITSRLGLLGFAGHGIYGASKSALERILEAAGTELAPHRVSILAISPGTLDTAMVREPELHGTHRPPRPPARLTAPDTAARIIVAAIARGARDISLPGGGRLARVAAAAAPALVRSLVAGRTAADPSR